jgi:DNA-binding SARP family transcriptional activator
MSDVKIELRLWLTGVPRLWLGEVDISSHLRYRKAWALLALLSFASPAWQSRSTLAALLWPDLDSSAALSNLRQLITNLVRVFNAPGRGQWLQVERNRLRLSVPCEGWLDTQALLAIGETVPDQTELICFELERSLPSCLGELLEGTLLAEGEAFSNWLVSARLRLQRARLAAMERLIQRNLATQQQAAALLIAQLRWKIDPLGEESAAHLIRMLLQLDDRRGAEQVAAELERNFRAELGVRPSEQIRGLLSHLAHKESPGFLGRTAEVAESNLIEQRTLLLMFVALPPLEQHEVADTGLTTLLAARTLLNDLRAGPLPLRGRGFWVAFGEQDGTELMLERALHAASELLQALPKRLSLGLAMGPVICRHLEGSAFDWFGNAPEQAWQLAHQAAAGEVLAERALVAHLPDWHAADGNLWCWHPAAGEPRRQSCILKPMVARQAQLKALNSAWAQAVRGLPCWVAVIGEAGMGKTRLVQALIESLDLQAASALLLHLRCSPSQQRQPLAPLRQALLNTFGDIPDTAAALKSFLLLRWPNLAQPEFCESVWRTLLHFFLPATQDDALVDGRDELLWALCLMLDAVSGHQPILLWMDDLHWADLATREWWLHYAGLLEKQPVLLVTTSRFDLPLHHLAASPLKIVLEPLEGQDAAELIAMHAEQVSLSQAQIMQIAQDSGGIPLFVEFLTRRYLDGGASSTHPIHGLLTQEIDRLGVFKTVLQSASLLGQRFYQMDLARLLPKEEPTPVLELACHYRLLQFVDEGCYEFRHALIRDAAYQGLPPKVAQRLHGQHAEWLSMKQGCSAAETAGHFEKAQRWQEAVHWWQRAGELALNASFASDALDCFLRAQRLFENCAAIGPSQQRQIGFAIGKAALLSEGYGSELGHRQYEALVLELADDPAADEDLFRALSGLYMGGSSLGRTEGLMIAERLNPLANTAAKRLMLCFAMGNSLFWRGRFEEAKQWQEEGIALAATLSADERTRYWGEDLAVLLRAFLCWNAWFLDQPILAAKVAAEGIQLARTAEKPHTLCFMLAFSAAERWCADDAAGAAVYAGEGLTLARHYGFPLWQGIHGLFALWSQARCGQLAELTPVLQAAAQFSQAYQAGTTTARWVVMSILLLLKCRTELLALLPQTRAGIAQYEDEYCLSEVLLIEALINTESLRAQELIEQAFSLANQQGAPGLANRLRRIFQEHHPNSRT